MALQAAVPPATRTYANLYTPPGNGIRLEVPAEAMARGVPEPRSEQVVWRKNGQIINASVSTFVHVIMPADAGDSGTYTVEMENAAGSGLATFVVTVADDPAGAVLTVYDPAAEAATPWEGGVFQPVIWGPITGERVDIDLSLDDGATWQTLAAGVADYGNAFLVGNAPFAFYRVPVPTVTTAQARLRVRRSGTAGDGLPMTAAFEIRGGAQTIRDWRQQHFGTRLGEGDAADAADPDFDRLTNLREYWLGGNPLDPADPPTSHLPAYRLSGPFFELRLPATATPPDLAFVVERTRDFRVWTTIADSRSVAGALGSITEQISGRKTGCLRVRLLRSGP